MGIDVDATLFYGIPLVEPHHEREFPEGVILDTCDKYGLGWGFYNYGYDEPGGIFVCDVDAGGSAWHRRGCELLEDIGTPGNADLIRRAAEEISDATHYEIDIDAKVGWWLSLSSG